MLKLSKLFLFTHYMLATWQWSLLIHKTHGSSWLILPPCMKGEKLHCEHHRSWRKDYSFHPSPAAIWEWSPVGREGWAAFGNLCESWWLAFGAVLEKAALSVSPQCYLQNFLPSFLPPALNLGGEPQKGTSCSPYAVPTSRKFLIHPSKASRDPMHLFNWHNMMGEHKRDPVITPAPSLIRCSSQTARGPS